MGHFFSPNSSGDLRSDAHQSQIIGGDADVDHTQIIRGDISTPSPPGFGTTGRMVKVSKILRFSRHLNIVQQAI